MEVGEADAVGGQFVEVWRSNLAAEAGEIAEAQVILCSTHATVRPLELGMLR